MTDAHPPLVAASLRLEETERLDPVIAKLEEPVGRLVGNGRRRRLLRGEPMGHAVHPVLSDLPYGAWLSATVLDLTGGPGARPSAARLVGVGLLAAVPTAVTGWAEWAGADRDVKRVGVVHAGANTAAIGLYASSWLARRGGRHVSGAVLGVAGALTVGLGGFLGGHMAIGRKHGSRHPAFAGTGRHTGGGVHAASGPHAAAGG